MPGFPVRRPRYLASGRLLTHHPCPLTEGDQTTRVRNPVVGAGAPRVLAPAVADRRNGDTLMSTVKETVEVDVPVHTAYNQWTQFETFPDFMEGVEEVRQLDDRHNHWTTKIGGIRREFDTEIVDQLPDERITWRSTTG